MALSGLKFFRGRARLAAAAILIALGAAGCASSDVSKDRDTAQSVAECLPPDTPAPTLIVRAIWLPGAHGFSSSDSSTLGRVTGVLALAGNRLWFMNWNDEEHHFDMRKTISVLDAANITLDRMGPSVLLVVEARNLSFDAFQLMGRGEIRSDTSGTEAFYAALNRLRAAHPSEP